MKLYQLMVEHTPEEESLDWTKIEPSVSLLKSPKGKWQYDWHHTTLDVTVKLTYFFGGYFGFRKRWRHGSHLYLCDWFYMNRLWTCQSDCGRSFFPLTDNIDDPTGNFRGTPLTGWKVFLLLLCSLLGIVVCAVVGAVVFQKRQERNKRFYWGQRRRGVCCVMNCFPVDRLSTFNVNFSSLKIVQMFISLKHCAGSELW